MKTVKQDILDHVRLTDVRAWLDKHNAMLLWDTNRKYVGNIVYVFAYSVNGRVVLVQVTDHNAAKSVSWEVYVPAGESSFVDETLENVEKRIGLK